MALLFARTPSGSKNTNSALRYAAAVALSTGVLAPAVAQQARVSVTPIPDQIWTNMQGRSWRADLPCPRREELVLLRAPYWDFAGRPRWGVLVVARSAASDVASALQEIFDSRQFRIAKMRLIDDYDGDDDASMADNNTSAFNCRRVTGGKGLSKHALGLAIDINPIQNPYRDSKGTAPPAGSAYDEPHERRSDVTGIIRKGDVVTRAFARIGWSWGGDFRHSKDYQHFAR